MGDDSSARKAKRVGRHIALAFGIVVISALGFFFTKGVLLVWAFADAWCVEEETARITSPDGKVDALTIRTNCGAMSSFVYKIYLVPKGMPAPEKATPVFTASNTETGVVFSWIGHRRLHIEYKKANIYEFRNFWYHPDTIEGSGSLYEVRITEAPVAPKP